jgi:hypothetical protein
MVRFQELEEQPEALRRVAATDDYQAVIRCPSGRAQLTDQPPQLTFGGNNRRRLPQLIPSPSSLRMRPRPNISSQGMKDNHAARAKEDYRGAGPWRVSGRPTKKGTHLGVPDARSMPATRRLDGKESSQRPDRPELTRSPPPWSSVQTTKRTKPGDLVGLHPYRHRELIPAPEV